MSCRVRGMFALLALSLIAAVAGCDKQSSSESTDEAAAAEKSEKEKSAKPSEVVFAFQPQENPQALAPDADRLAKYMTDEIGIKSEVFLPTSYAAVVEALRSENADVA
ncbi:MAG: PhnD/SsuA/transferrin family substrate-binding protein, partial [Bradymonadaceae bacterium]